MIKLRYLLPGLVLLSCVKVGAQSLSTDTSFIASASTSAMAFYNKSIQGSSHLYNGSQYQEYRSLKDEHPYFKPDWEDASIFYDGEYYKNISLLYDISSDNLVTEYFYNGEKIQLISTKVKSFQLSGRNFVRLNADAVISEGFYDLVYDGKIKFYIRWRKSLKEEVKATEVIREFEEKQNYYLLKGGIYYQVKNRKSVLEVFNDRKEELKSFVKTNRLKFKKTRERDVALATEFYDHLSKSEVK